MQKENTRVFKIILAIITALLFVIVFHKMTHFVYQTNDDLFMEQIVSGQTVGKADPHMVFVQYPLGVILAGLYSLSNSVPWYGLFLCLGILAVQVVVLIGVLANTKKAIEIILAELLFALGSYSFVMPLYAKVQFTLVSTVLGAGTLFILILWNVKDSFKENIAEIVLMLLLSFASFACAKSLF